MAKTGDTPGCCAAPPARPNKAGDVMQHCWSPAKMPEHQRDVVPRGTQG